MSKCKRQCFIDEKYCTDDGVLLKQTPTPKCSNCGNFKIGNFCSKCGKKFKVSENKNDESI